MMPSRRLSALCLAAMIAALPAAAQTGAPPPGTAEAPAAAQPLLDRANALPEILAGKVDYPRVFADSFIAQIPKAQFDEVTRQLTVGYGPPERIERVTATTAWSAIVAVEFRDALLEVALAVDPAGDHRITGLLVRGVTAREATLDAIDAAMRQLKGQAGYVLAKLGDGAPQIARHYHADQAFAIGSEFKLVILAELIRATNAGERKWDDLVTLDGKDLPGGGYTQKPAGTKVSLRELATQMISISDNSATDILLKTLGREKVEAMMPVLGIADPARNRPFLSTGEVFKLKTIPALRDRYLPAATAGRRALLAGDVAATPIARVDSTMFAAGKPLSIDTLEWFLSPNDLVRVMDWIRRNTEGPKGAEARAVLSKNPGVPGNVASEWAWVGYKGGSEPGVIAMTLLMRSKGGDWYALSASWNDVDQPVDSARFVGLVSKAAALSVPAAPPPAQ